MDKLWSALIGGSYANDDELYHLLSSLLVELQTEETFHLEAGCKLLNIFDEQHLPSVQILTCMIVSCLCKSSLAAKEDLARRGAISSLMGLLRVAVGEFNRATISSPDKVLNDQLARHVTSVLQYFSLGPSVCVAKLLRPNILASLVSLVDVNSCLLSVNVKETVLVLMSLIEGRKLVGKRQSMLTGVADYVGCCYFGPEGVSKLLLQSKPFVVDLYDTSTAEDVHIISKLAELRGTDKVWLYDDADDPEIDKFEKGDGEWVDVHVTHTIDGAYFWAVLGPDDKDLFDGLVNQLKAAVAGKHCLQYVDLGQLVYATNQSIGWYRAQVLAVDDFANSVRLFAIDHGFIETVSMECLRLADDYDKNRSVPPLAHLCKLKGVRRVLTNRDAFVNVLGTLCNLTASDEFWSRMATDERSFTENGLPSRLFHLGRCPDVELQIMVLKICANLARNDVLRPLVMESGICAVAFDLLKKNRNCPRTVQWTQLMEVCLQLIANLIYKCKINREKFTELQGVHKVIRLCALDLPACVRQAAVAAIKAFIEEIKCEKEVSQSSVLPSKSKEEKNVSTPRSQNLLLDLGADGVEDYSGAEKFQFQESQKKYFLGEKLNLKVDDNNELILDPLEHTNRDTFADLICAFLNNTSGGSVFHGIQPSRDGLTSIVRGVQLTHSVRDTLRLSIDKLMIQRISPTVSPGMVCTHLHSVVDQTTGEVIPDLRIIELEIKRPPSMTPILYTSIYPSARFGFVRVQGTTKKLASKDIYVWTVEMVEKKLLRSIEEIESDLSVLRKLF